MRYKIPVLERATKLNFSPERYLSANLDVRRAFGPTAAGAKRHFDLYGHRELRFQLASVLEDALEVAEFQSERFERFRPVLRPTSATAFPVHYTLASLTLDSFEGESAHPTPANFAAELANHPQSLYADIGAGLRDYIFMNCVNVEIYQSVTTDLVISPGAELPFNDASLDGIGCFAVLEHLRQPWKMAEEMARVVKPGGRIFIDWPFLQPVHGYPSHFYNATQEGMRALFVDNFDIAEIGTEPHQGLDYTLTWLTNGLLTSIEDLKLRKKMGKMTLAQIAAEPPGSPLWQAVIATAKDKTNTTFACGNSLVAVRKAALHPEVA